MLNVKDMIGRTSLISLATLLMCLAPAAHAGESGAAQVSVKVTDFEGNKRSCASETVYAVPVREKTTKTIFQYYRNVDAGYASIYATPELILRREGTKFVGGGSVNVTRLFRQRISGLKRGRCNENSVAEIRGLKPGAYYLILPVFWKQTDIKNDPKDIAIRTPGRTVITIKLPTNYRGGTYMVRTEITGTETVSFDLVNVIPDDSSARK
ncbi:MAG: hypothetical protein KDA43_09990 [Hyphomonas sp.]|nr:hypothetical protein [Hyphomonas sp.]